MLDVIKNKEGIYEGFINGRKVLGAISKNEVVAAIRTLEAMQLIIDPEDTVIPYYDGVDKNHKCVPKASIICVEGKEYTAINMTKQYLTVIEGIGNFSTNYVRKSHNDSSLSQDIFGNLMMLPTPKGCSFIFNEYKDVEYSILPDDVDNDKALIIKRQMPVYDLVLPLMVIKNEETSTEEQSTYKGFSSTDDEIPF